MQKKENFSRVVAVLAVCGVAYSASTSLSVPKKACAEGIAKAECVMELNSRRVLYETHGDVRLPMASTTKIITAATVLEHCKNLQEQVIIPPQAEGVEGSSVYLKAGDSYTVEELLYGLMLRSGNDCATALAYHFGGNIGTFSAKMNEIAQKAGALQSHLKNPHGLPCSGHYTTARDLTGITCYAMHNSEFRKIVSTRYFEARKWKNKNKLLYQFDGAIGVKTGYTKEAGRCLVSAAERNGMTLVCTVLHCGPMYERSATLLNDAFAAYKYTSILAENEIFAIENGKKLVKGYVKESFSYPLMKGEEGVIEYKATPIEYGLESKKEEEIIGQLEIYLAKRLLFSTKLYKL